MAESREEPDLPATRPTDPETVRILLSVDGRVFRVGQQAREVVHCGFRLGLLELNLKPHHEDRAQRRR